MSELEKRVEAIEAWIEQFVSEGEEFLKHMETLEEEQVEIVFIPDTAPLRNKKRDN